MIVVLLYAIDSYAQSEYTIPLPDSIVAFDIISIDGDYIHIVSQNGIYEINGSSIVKYVTFNDMDITQNLSENHLIYNNDQKHSYPIAQGGYISIINKDSIVRKNINATPKSIRSDSSAAIIDFDNKSVSIENNKINVLPHQLATLKIDTSNKIQSLAKQHNITGVIKTFENQDSSILFLTNEKLYRLFNNNISVAYTIGNDTTEELISIHIDQNNNTWILSTQKVIILTPPNLLLFDLPKGNKIYQPYKIRDRLYCSNGLQILHKHNEKWQPKKGLKVPQNVIIDLAGDPYLIYKNKAEKLSKSNARLLEKTNNFEEELIEDINLDYICTSKSVYNNRIKINETTDHYYKSIIHNDKIVIVGQSGIYAYANNSFSLLKSAHILKSKNYFLEDGHLFYFTENTINYIEVENPENESTIALKKTKILDFISIENELIVLTSRSVLYLDKKALLRDRVIINKVIPISPKLTEAKLNNIDGSIWISTRESLLLINDNLNERLGLPTLTLIENSSQNGLTTTLKSNNFYSDNINYTYYINSPDGTKTIWTKDPNITLDRDPSINVNIIAKMNDDVFAQDIYSNDVTIIATKSPLIDIMIKIIAAILATLLILWAIRKWITS